MPATRQLFLFHLIAALFCTRFIAANVLFHFGFDFKVNSDVEEHINKTILVENNQISFIDNNVGNSKELSSESVVTGAPTVTLTTPQQPLSDEMRAKQQKLMELTNEKLKLSLEALTDLYNEILPLVGRSDDIAARVKLITRYRNEVLLLQQTETTDRRGENKFIILNKFVDLVDELKKAPAESEGGKRSLSFKIMELALEKYDLIKQQSEVREQVLPAKEAWQRFVKEKFVEVSA